MPMLTDYDTDEPVFVKSDTIKSARPLPSQSFSQAKEVQEFGKRTKIDTGTDIFHVSETVEEVMAFQLEFAEKILKAQAGFVRLDELTGHGETCKCNNMTSSIERSKPFLWAVRPYFPTVG